MIGFRTIFHWVREIYGTVRDIQREIKDLRPVVKAFSENDVYIIDSDNNHKFQVPKSEALFCKLGMEVTFTPKYGNDKVRGKIYRIVRNYFRNKDINYEVLIYISNKDKL